jgi:hypothetical protein
LSQQLRKSPQVLKVCQPIEADDYSMKPMVTDVLPMVTDVYPMVAEESCVANPQKVAKIDEKIRKMQKDGLATLLLLMNYPIP